MAECFFCGPNAILKTADAATDFRHLTLCSARSDYWQPAEH